MRALFRSIPPTLVLPTDDGVGSSSSMLSAMKHWSIQLKASIKRSRMSLACIRIRGNFSSECPHRSCSSIVHHDLNAKHAFAFGINLQSQFAAVQLKDRQIIRRFLDGYFPLG